MILLESRPGQVVQFNDPGVQSNVNIVDLPDDPISFESRLSIITRVVLSQKANVQFLHTLGSSIYVYVFGDRMGSIGLSGLSFATNCDELNAPEGGAELMLKWYRDNRVTKRQKPVRIMIGNIPIEGFVVDSSIDVVDPQTLLVQWNLNIMALPEG